MHTRNSALDYLKALLIAFVVIWHARPWLLTQSPLFLPKALLGFFYFNITTLAVPTFLLVSLHLYHRHRDSAPGYFRKRILRLGQVYLFWMGAQWLFAWAVTGQLAPIDIRFLMDGGPGAPYVGGSVFYYLADLLLLTLLEEAYARLPEASRPLLGWIMAGFSLAYIPVAQIFHLSGTNYLEVFILYVPAAYYATTLRRYRHAFALGWLVFSCLESFLIATFDVYMTPYIRWGNVLGALALMGYALSFTPPPSRIAETLSRYSLGIYAVHKMALCLGYILLASLALPQAQQKHSNPQLLGLFLFTILGTWAMLRVMNSTPLRRYIR
jgi:surface polysaccharide O-acyltransferase-like enzyme